ncbi:MAG: hypothetical protein JOY70_04315 [Acidisphaera sp.]|nr:hypothetical protein [Acidisphaera sp.]MBV9813066.1 hypothetical protein [Acetobacteraceae bacterium]
MATTPPTVRFYRLIEQARPPMRADRSAAGTLPTRAFRYCDAVTRASAFGWYVFPPLDFHLMFDGEEMLWTYDGVDTWLPLSAAQFPDFAARFDEVAPAALRGAAPPFLTALPEPGTVQVWTGLFARTAPGWDLLARRPANLWVGGGFAQYEGVVECDRWFGPLFTNLRLTRTGTPVHIRGDVPLLQVQPLPKHLFDEEVLGAMEVIGSPADFAEADWNDYASSVVAPNDDPDRRPGSYAVEARKRRAGKCPFTRA